VSGDVETNKQARAKQMKKAARRDISTKRLLEHTLLCKASNS
jgi:hypothetical protein